MKVLYLSLLMFVSVSVYGQASELTHDSGFVKHGGVDEIYAKFSKAYRELDHAAFMSLYTKDAAYLVSVITSTSVTRTSRTDSNASLIRSGRRARRLRYRFQIVQRNMAYDVGIYTLLNHKDGKQIGEAKGKFVVVAIKGGKTWRFQVDGYSDLPKAAKIQ